VFPKPVKVGSSTLLSERECGNADDVTAGVAINVGIYAYEDELAYFDTCFLKYFAATGGLNRLTHFDKAPR